MINYLLKIFLLSIKYHTILSYSNHEAACPHCISSWEVVTHADYKVRLWLQFHIRRIAHVRANARSFAFRRCLA